MARLYTKTKIFHFTEKLDSLPAAHPEILPPLHVRIKPTNVCNHSCRYCAYRVDHLQLGKDMGRRDAIPREAMLRIVEDLAAMDVKAVTFSGGGDPFCYPHLPEVVERLAATPVRFAALTNGSRLQGEPAELFARHGTWLRVSMDGWDDESYCRYRGVRPGTFDTVLANLAAFKGYGGDCYLGVSLIVNALNASHVYPFMERMKTCGVDSVKVSPCIVSNDGGENNQYHRPFFDAVRDQVARAEDRLADDTFEIYNAYHELEEKFSKEYTWCPYLQILPILGADLTIYSCQDKAYNRACGAIGSIREQGFRAFWFADKAKFFTINPARDCNHHCVANEKNRLVLEYLDADKRHLGFV